jgi:large subunit ribosomal protein L4
MIEVPIKNLQGEVVSTARLDERVWDITPNMAVLHQAVVAQQANARRGTADTKTRGEVRGGGKKHHRQKGTGMARQGSTRSPHWRGGGVVFGPHPRDWHQDLPKKMRRLAMRSALSAKLDDEAVILVDGWQIADGKTREMVRSLAALEVGRGALLVLPERDQMVERAGSNIPRVRAVTPNTLNLLDVLKADRLIFTPAAAEAVTERLLRPVRLSRTASRVGTAPKRGAASERPYAARHRVPTKRGLARQPEARPEPASPAPEADAEETA